MKPPIRVADTDTDAWYAARKTGIGASEAASVLGLRSEDDEEFSYQTPLEIYSRKLGLIPEIEDNIPMRMGRRLEKSVRDEFAYVTERTIVDAPCPMYRHPEFPFMLATPDAILDDFSLLECKTTTWRRAKTFGQDGTDECPVEWLLQAQQQLAVMGLYTCHLAALVDGRNLRRFVIERDDELIKALAAAEAELWDRIERRDPPEPTWTHSSTPELVKKLHGNSTGEIIYLTDDMAALWAEQDAIGKQVKELEKRRDELRARVTHFIGAAAIARMPEGDKEIARIYIEGGPRSSVTKPHYRLSERKVK